MFTYSKTSHCTSQIYTFLFVKNKYKIKNFFFPSHSFIDFKKHRTKPNLDAKKADIFLKPSISQQ